MFLESRSSLPQLVKPNGEPGIDSPSLSQLKLVKPPDNSNLENTELSSDLARELQKILLVIARYISKDFDIPVELNEPGQGWHWDFTKNVIKVDPLDLLEKPLSYLRFVVAHEAAHRKISRFVMVPDELWQTPGYSFLSNVIEDPRVNNFLLNVYPALSNFIAAAYQEANNSEQRISDRAMNRLGHVPKFIEAGYAFIRIWYSEATRTRLPEPKNLDPLVLKVLLATEQAASNAWNCFPSMEESDSGELVIQRFATKTFLINSQEIWPEYRKLLEQDLENQMVQELVKDLSGQNSNKERQQAEDATGSLTTAAQQNIENAVSDALRDRVINIDPTKQMGTPIPLNSISASTLAELKKQLQQVPYDYYTSLEKRATEALRSFEAEATQEISDVSAAEADPMSTELSNADWEELKKDLLEILTSAPKKNNEVADDRDDIRYGDPGDIRAYKNFRKQVRKEEQDLEQQLREILSDRKRHRYISNHKSGTKIDIARRIREVAKSKTVLESRAWERKTAPSERNYAITLLVDLTGSMHGEKITETFKAVVAVAEPLQKLGIELEVLGFNSTLQVYKEFEEDLNDRTRERMSGMLQEVHSKEAAFTDDGWALLHASHRLEEREAKRKFIIVLSDGCSNVSPAHNYPRYELSAVLAAILNETKQRVIGLGLGSDTAYMQSAYPVARAEIRAQDLPEILAQLLKEILSHE